MLLKFLTFECQMLDDKDLLKKCECRPCCRRVLLWSGSTDLWDDLCCKELRVFRSISFIGIYRIVFSSCAPNDVKRIKSHVYILTPVSRSPYDTVRYCIIMFSKRYSDWRKELTFRFTRNVCRCVMAWFQHFASSRLLHNTRTLNML